MATEALVGEMEDVLEEYLSSVKRLPGVKCYTRGIRIFAPTCFDGCVDAVDDLEKVVADLFQGSTSYMEQAESARSKGGVRGCWYNPKDKELLCEPIRVIEAARGCMDERTAERLMEAIVAYGKRAGQQQLAVEGGSFYVGTPYQFQFGEIYARARRRQWGEKGTQNYYSLGGRRGLPAKAGR